MPFQESALSWQLTALLFSAQGLFLFQAEFLIAPSCHYEIFLRFTQTFALSL